MSSNADDLTTQLAKSMFENHAGFGWSGVSESVREIYTRSANIVIAHLTSTGRLIPAGGMALTAEQASWVQTLSQADPWWDEEQLTEVQAHVRALFPATEPAEHVHEQGAHYTKGHTKAGAWTVSTCRTCGAVIERGSEDGAWVESTDPPAPAEPVENEAETETEWAIEFPGGICNISFDPADPEEMLQWIRDGKLVRRDVTTGPWVDAVPAPAEPAEEETKAEARPQLLTPNQIRDANPGKHETFIFGQQRADGTACVGCSWQTYEVLDTVHAVAEHDDAKGLVHDHAVWITKNGICPCGHPASSPVVPASTEAGPWQRIEDVPEGVLQIKDRHGRTWLMVGGTWRFEWHDGNWHEPHTNINAQAPFVAAAEEG